LKDVRAAGRGQGEEAMRFMHATNAQAVDDAPTVEVTFTDNVSGDGLTEFKADWVEVWNSGAQPLTANPYHTPADSNDGVVIPAGERFRFEWNQGDAGPARDHSGYASVFLVSNGAGTTTYVTAGAA